MSSSGQLPNDFHGPAAWTAADLQHSESRWLNHLSSAEIRELEKAAEQYLVTRQDISSLTKACFRLPTLQPYLQQLKHKLLHGNGIEVIRGLDVQRYSLDEAACIFCGIGAHLGQYRPQNANGDVLGHVKDLGLTSANTNARIYQTAERQSFHTDSADVVGLFCWRSAKQGGDSLLVSALSLYNEFKRQRPDLLPLLFEPIATDRRGEVPKGQLPYVLIPVFSWFEKQLTVFYQRQYIESAQRFDSAPRLTDAHIEALDLFDALANNQELHFRMRLEPGDMQFVYNHSQLHDRTAFEDWPDPDNRRHMLRLWLSMEGDRALPDCFRARYGSIEVGNRGGIVLQ